MFQDNLGLKAWEATYKDFHCMPYTAAVNGKVSCYGTTSLIQKLPDY